MPNIVTHQGKKISVLINSLIPALLNRALNCLKNAGHKAYIVGGAVRDIYLKRPISDWDVATSAVFEEMKLIFHDIRHFALKHDTLTIIDDKHQIHLTHFKGKKNTLQEDLALRDFTINSLAYNHDKGQIIDLFGAKKDIRRRLIKTVGNPKKRFYDDPLRLLRAIRLSNELNFQIDSETLKAISSCSSLLRSVSPERIRDELMLILLSKKPSMSFSLMRKTGLLVHFLPELAEGYRKRQNAHHKYTILRHVLETVDRTQPQPVLRLAALFHDIAKPRKRNRIGEYYRFFGHEEASENLCRVIMRRLKFSNDMVAKVTHLIGHHMINNDAKWSDAAIRRLIRRVGSENINDLLLLRRADILARGLNDEKLYLLNELEARINIQLSRPIPMEIRHLAINGHKVMECLGLSPGPKVGKILNALMEIVIDHPYLNDEKELTRLLDQMKEID